MVTVLRSSIVVKILSLALAVALLALNLSSYKEDDFATSVEDVIFDIPTLSADDVDSATENADAEENLRKAKGHLVIDLYLNPRQELSPLNARPQLPSEPVVAVLSINNLLAEIFIPPEAFSRG